LKKVDLMSVKFDGEVKKKQKALQTIEEKKGEITKLNYIIKDTTQEHEFTKKEH